MLLASLWEVPCKCLFLSLLLTTATMKDEELAKVENMLEASPSSIFSAPSRKSISTLSDGAAVRHGTKFCCFGRAPWKRIPEHSEFSATVNFLHEKAHVFPRICMGTSMLGVSYPFENLVITGREWLLHSKDP